MFAPLLRRLVYRVAYLVWLGARLLAEAWADGKTEADRSLARRGLRR
jgi:threonine/homoserine/homoserine lactone efflux protein